MDKSIEVRWMIRKDMPSVLAIEGDSFDHPWNETDFIRCLRQRAVIGMVAEIGTVIAGFMIYELHKTRIHLLNFAVASGLRRIGVGSEMLNALHAKLKIQKRNLVGVEVRETNLDAQLFFKASGYRAVSVLKKFYDDSDEDAYRMQYRCRNTDVVFEVDQDFRGGVWNGS